jgi:hypothetical protein
MGDEDEAMAKVFSKLHNADARSLLLVLFGHHLCRSGVRAGSDWRLANRSLWVAGALRS